jgi:hypothetical protein
VALLAFPLLDVGSNCIQAVVALDHLQLGSRYIVRSLVEKQSGILHEVKPPSV